MTAREAVEAARAFAKAAIIPVQFEDWAHTEGREQIARFSVRGFEQRLRWPEPGRAVPIKLS